MRRRQYNAICDVCGFKFKNWQLKKRWDNLMVCDKDWEQRHPMDFYRVPRTEAFPPWTRPEPTPIIVGGWPSPVRRGYGLVVEGFVDGDGTGFFLTESDGYIMLEGATT